MIVCLDTHILIWALRDIPPGEEDESGLRAQALLALLEKDKHTVLIPSPVLSEFLLGVEEERQPEIAQEITRRFEVVPFDAAAAVATASLWVRKNGGRSLSSTVGASVGNTPRQAIKVDFQILGIAISRRAEVIYSHDRGLKALARGESVRVEEMPPLSALRLQITMWDLPGCASWDSSAPSGSD